LAVSVRILRTPACFSFGSRSIMSAARPLASAAAIEVPVVIWYAASGAGTRISTPAPPPRCSHAHDHHHDEVLACAVNLLIARHAYREAAPIYPDDRIELRQGARVVERSKWKGARPQGA
jgi:hypothetical protein